MHKKTITTKKVIISLCLLLVAAAAGFGVWRFMEDQKAREAAEAARLAAEILEAVTVKGKQPFREFNRPAPPPPEPRQGILDWQAQNPDTIGHLRIDGTRVDYPVVQGTDNDYYLNYTFDHIRATRGSIFLDSNVSFDPLTMPRHMLIHGHHMRDGSMFQNVSLFKRRDYFYEHPYIRFETLYMDTVWEVFSVYVCDSNEYVPMSFKSEEAYLIYLEKTRERSLFPVDLSLSADDVILTLNTCSYEFQGAHTLVAARLAEAVINGDATLHEAQTS